MKNIRIPLKLIQILSDGECYSGEYLGDMLGMNFVDINKYIQTIRGWGLDVLLIREKGYSLPEPVQLLDKNFICFTFPESTIAVLPVIDSTNQYLLDRLDSLRSGDVCIAEYQNAGRGRRGNQWQSPFGANLYLSMFWRLENGPAVAVGVSLAIAVVIAEVLHRLGAQDVKVKWPNDLYMHNRKLAGILVELIGKTGNAAQLVIGIGINLRMRPSSGKEVKQKWINLQEAGIDVNRNILTVMLLAELGNALEVFEQQGGLCSFIPRWRAIDNYYNCPVKLIMGKRKICVIERGIDEKGAILLEEDGKVKAYVNNEISLREK
ncbi:MAG: bifunctional biotin--[acetyl-CoA-carboxylase] ligase/biotin operon repressor BirA [Candidatus Malihini olakiniferum]